MGRSDPIDLRRDDRRAARRAQLLEDAVEAIREVGPGVTMEQLARRGGVTKPILYRHFRDRDGLITCIAEQFSVELLREIEGALQTTTDPEKLLSTTIDAYLAFIEKDPSVYRFLLQHATSRIGGLTQMSPLVDTIARRVAVVVGDQLRSAGLDSGPAVPWGYGIVGMVHHAGDWWLEDRTMSREHLTSYLSTLLWQGLERASGSVPNASTS